MDIAVWYGRLGINIHGLAGFVTRRAVVWAPVPDMTASVYLTIMIMEVFRPFQSAVTVGLMAR